LVLVLIGGLVAVSTAAPLVRLAMNAARDRTVSFSFLLAAARLTLAALVLLPKWRTVVSSQPSRTALQWAIAAGVALALHFAAWITSLAFTSVAASTTLVTTTPLWVTLLSWWWWGEKPTRKVFIGTGLALSGALLIGWGSTEATAIARQPWLGNALALIGAWAVTFYLLLGREAQRQGLGIGSYITVAYTTAAIALLPLPYLAQADAFQYVPPVYGYILLTTLIPQLIGHTSLNWVVRWVSPTLVTLVVLFEPVIASLLAFWLFAEVPSPTVFIGALILLGGVAIASLNLRP
jgi:drug/metabolite transporter (DMT)-like permease